MPFSRANRAFRRANAACLAFALLFSFTATFSFALVVAAPNARGVRLAFGILCAVAAGTHWLVWSLIQRIYPKDE